MKTVNGSDLGASKGLKMVSQRLTEERALKEVTNRLEEKPVKLKPTWVGMKTRSGSVSREVETANHWVTHKAKSAISGNGLREKTNTKPRSGPLPSWPPDPIRSLNKEESLAVAPKTLRKIGMGLLRKRREIMCWRLGLVMRPCKMWRWMEDVQH